MGDGRDVLDHPASARWAEWRARVAEADPSGAEAALRAFVEETERWAPRRRQAWVDDWCRVAFDGPRTQSCPASLAQGLVLPELARGVRAGRPGCARWMAQVPHALDLHRAAAGLPPGGGWREALLERALAVDPDDHRARRLLLSHLRAEVEWATGDAGRAGPSWVAARALRIAGLAAELDEACPDDVERWLRTAAGWASARPSR